MAGSYLLSARAAAETLAIGVPTVLDSVLGRGSFEACDERLSRWSRRVVTAAGIDLVVHGREVLARARPGETFVIMSNHRSHYDIPVLFDALRGRTLRMVTKTELFRIPVFGPAMRAAGFIEIDRGDRQRAIASLREARRTLARGVDVWIAPEGTRTRDARLAAFKKGGFVLALETGLRILPIGIRGTERVLRPGTGASFSGVRVDVAIGEPIDTASFGEARRSELIDATRAAIATLLGERDPASGAG